MVTVNKQRLGEWISEMDPLIYRQRRPAILKNYENYFPDILIFFKEELSRNPSRPWVLKNFCELFLAGGIDQELCEILLDFYPKIEDSRLLAMVVSAFAQWEEADILPHLVPLLVHTDSRVVANTVEIFGEQGNSQDHLQLIEPLVRHPHHRVKTAALIALYRYGEIGVLDLVRTMLTHPDDVVRRSGAFALGKMAHFYSEYNPLRQFLVNFLSTQQGEGAEMDRQSLFSLGWFISKRF